MEGALALTATHVSERQQFGSPIGTFQAVAQRSADGYIDTEAVRLTSWSAAWRLDAGLPATTSWRSPPTGRPTAASGSCTPPSTCTAASVSTPTTRSTATSGGPRCSSCWSRAPRAPSSGSAPRWRPALLRRPGRLRSSALRGGGVHDDHEDRPRSGRRPANRRSTAGCLVAMLATATLLAGPQGACTPFGRRDRGGRVGRGRRRRQHPPSPAAGGRLDQGSFGDLTEVCGEGAAAAPRRRA